MGRGDIEGPDMMKTLSERSVDGITLNEDVRGKPHWRRTKGQVGLDRKLVL